MNDPYAGWPTKSQLAKETGASERTLDRMVSRGEIQQAYRGIPGRRPVAVIAPADAERLRQQYTTPAPFIVQQPDGSGSKPNDSGAALMKAGTNVNGLDALTTALTAAMRGAAAGNVKLFLTLDEAVEYSGLPRAYLLKQLRSGELPSLKFGSWRIRRTDLEKL